jgi:cytochrome b6-f complex iron-sulfur subunit
MRPTTEPEPGSSPPECPRRRLFLKQLAALGISVALDDGLSGCHPYPSPAPYAHFPAPKDGLLVIAVALYPDLARQGGAITAIADGVAGPLLIVHSAGDSYFCTASTCTHEACPLGFDGGAIVCPCHGSEYDLGGQVTRPPARQPLLTYQATYMAESGKLVVDLHATGQVFPAPVSGEVTLSLSQYPTLAQPGGTEEGTPKGELNALLVIALASGQYAALNPLCTHASCAFVELAPADGLLHCPCHGSVFATDGTVRHGPATQPLTTYPATFDGVAVRVKLT